MINKEAKYLSDMGSNVKAYRKKRHLTQKELAVKCEMGEASISKIESGKMNISVLTLKKIAVALEVSPAIFFSE